MLIPQKTVDELLSLSILVTKDPKYLKQFTETLNATSKKYKITYKQLVRYIAKS